MHCQFGVGPQHLAAARIQAVDAAVLRVPAATDGGGDHHEVIFSGDLDDRRGHVPRDAREGGGLPPDRAGQLVVGDDTDFRRLRRHDQQITVDQRVLHDRPARQLGAAAEVLPDVRAPDRLPRLDADRVQVPHRADGVDVLAVHGGRRARAGEHEAARRVVGEGPQLLAARQVEHAQRVADLLVSVQQIDVPAADGGSAEAGRHRDGPEHRRAGLGPCPQELLLLRGVVAPRAVEPRPVGREGRGDRQRNHDRDELRRVLHHVDHSSRRSTRRFLPIPWRCGVAVTDRMPEIQATIARPHRLYHGPAWLRLVVQAPPRTWRPHPRRARRVGASRTGEPARALRSARWDVSAAAPGNVCHSPVADEHRARLRHARPVPVPRGPGGQGPDARQ